MGEKKQEKNKNDQKNETEKKTLKIKNKDDSYWYSFNAHSQATEKTEP